MYISKKKVLEQADWIVTNYGSMCHGSYVAKLVPESYYDQMTDQDFLERDEAMLHLLCDVLKVFPTYNYTDGANILLTYAFNKEDEMNPEGEFRNEKLWLQAYRYAIKKLAELTWLIYIRCEPLEKIKKRYQVA